MENVCPCCNRDPLDKLAYQESLKICKEYEVNGNHCNPGGRQLRFRKIGDKWLQLFDYCYFCDLDDLKKFIKENE